MYALGLGFELYSSVDPHERERRFKKKFQNATSEYDSIRHQVLSLVKLFDMVPLTTCSHFDPKTPG